MSESWIGLGGITAAICVALLFVSTLLIIIGAMVRKRLPWLLDWSIKLLLFSLLVGLVGFGVCTVGLFNSAQR